MKQDIKFEFPNFVDSTKLAMVYVSNGNDKIPIRAAVKANPAGVTAISEGNAGSLASLDLSFAGTEFTTTTLESCNVEHIPWENIATFIAEQRKRLVERIGVIKFTEIDQFISNEIKACISTFN